MSSAASPVPACIGELASGHRERVAELLAATRIFNEEEIDAALDLFDDVFPRGTHGTTYGTTDAPPSSSSYAFLGAFTPEDQLVGYARYGPTPETDRTCDPYRIAVDPRAQGTGGGTRLLTEVERRLQGLNVRMLVVETSSRSDHAPTRRCYERRRYAEAARVRGFCAPGDDRIILTKRFQSFPSSPTGRGAVQQ